MSEQGVETGGPQRPGHDAQPVVLIRPTGRNVRRLASLRTVGAVAAVALAAMIAMVGVTIAATPTLPAYAITIEIEIRYSHYGPATIAVPVGVPVRFVIHNLDPIDHEWIVGDAAAHSSHRTGTELRHAARPTEISIAAGQMIATVVTFSSAGSFQYICHLPGHEAYGMSGVVVVQ